MNTGTCRYLLLPLVVLLCSCSTYSLNNAAEDAAFLRGWDRECTPAAGAKPQVCSETYWSTTPRTKREQGAPFQLRKPD